MIDFSKLTDYVEGENLRVAKLLGLMTLGEAINTLQRIPDDQLIYLDFCRFTPGDVHSYRGYYSHLAVNYIADPDVSVTVAGFLGTLEWALGETFHGYKGGEYVMTNDTPLWVTRDDRDASGTAIMDIKAHGHAAVIHTAFVEL